MDWDFNGLYIIVSFLLGILFFFLGVIGLVNPEIFKWKSSLVPPNRFLLFLAFLFASMFFLLITAAVLGSGYHKHKFA
jgi:hypothetical protein